MTSHLVYRFGLQLTSERNLSVSNSSDDSAQIRPRCAGKSGMEMLKNWAEKKSFSSFWWRWIKTAVLSRWLWTKKIDNFCDWSNRTTRSSTKWISWQATLLPFYHTRSDEIIASIQSIRRQQIEINRTMRWTIVANWPECGLTSHDRHTSQKPHFSEPKHICELLTATAHI